MADTLSPGTMSQVPSGDVHFPPIENGLDYLCSVVDHLVKTGDETPGPRDLKYAVLHLQAAVEVPLKARLQAEDWTLVFRVPSTAARAKFESGEFESCSTGETLARLRNIVGLEFAEKDVTALNNLRGDRNALQHYGLTASGPATEARAGHVLDLLVGFLDEQLLSTLDAAVVDRLERDYTGRIRSGLGEIRAFVRNRMNRLRPELDPWSPRDARDNARRARRSGRAARRSARAPPAGVRALYTHTTPAVRTAMLEALESRWIEAGMRSGVEVAGLFDGRSVAVTGEREQGGSGVSRARCGRGVAAES